MTSIVLSGWWRILGVALVVVSVPSDPRGWWRYVMTGAAHPVEPGEHRVILADGGPERIDVIKVVRKITGLGLVAAKSLVDSAPHTVVQKVSIRSAERIQALLVEVGATAHIEACDAE